MILAHEARKETEKKQNDKTFMELSLLEKEIREAIEKGEYMVHHDGSISEETKKKLKEYGYSVEVNIQYNETITTIRWDKILRGINT